MDRNRHMATQTTSPTADTAQADEGLRRVTASRPTDWYTTAARAAHNTHCTPCRERTAASEAFAAENAASMARRDRHQLGLRIVTPRTAVA